MVWFIISTLSSILTISLWFRDLVKLTDKFNYRFFYPIIFVILTLFSTYQGFKLKQINEIKEEAKEISKKWPQSNYLQYCSTGELYGIILSGQSFLEKNKDELPQSYIDFENYKHNRLKEFTTSNDRDYDNYKNLTEVCNTLMTIIDNLKE